MAELKTEKLALHGGKPVRGPERAWPKWPIVTDAERQAINEVLESGKWWYGEQVARFETDYAAHQDARFGVTCNSGTAAAEICLQALGMGPGDEVIVPAYTFIATASCAARMGGVPVFVDVNETWCMDPDAAEAAITPRTKAIIPVHFGSCLADMDRFQAISEKYGIPIIEDACHSWGAKWKGKGTGALGQCGVFSFQMSKNLTAGEGGLILSDNESFAETCRAITNCGRVRDGLWYGHPMIGTNARMTEFQAALLNCQLARLEAERKRREENAKILDGALASIDGLTPQPGDPRISHRTYHLYGMRIEPEVFGCTREKFLEASKAEGLSLGPGYPMPLYKQPAFGMIRNAPDYSQAYCPVSEDLCYTSGFWFSHPILLGSEDDINDVVRIFNKIKANTAELGRE